MWTIQPRNTWVRVEGSTTTDRNIQWSNVPLIHLHFPSCLYFSSALSVLGLQSAKSKQQWRTLADFSAVSRGSSGSVSWRVSWPFLYITCLYAVVCSHVVTCVCFATSALVSPSVASLRHNDLFLLLISSLSLSLMASLLSGLCMLNKETVTEIRSVAVSTARSNCC